MDQVLYSKNKFSWWFYNQYCLVLQQVITSDMIWCQKVQVQTGLCTWNIFEKPFVNKYRMVCPSFSSARCSPPQPVWLSDLCHSSLGCLSDCHYLHHCPQHWGCAEHCQTDSHYSGSKLSKKFYSLNQVLPWNTVYYLLIFILLL